MAALALGKGAKAIHQSGRWYTNENIDGLLMERHMAKVARRKSKNHLKGPAKRTVEDMSPAGRRGCGALTYDDLKAETEGST